MAKKKKRSSTKRARKPIGIVKIPKGNKRKLKPGYALVYGSRTKPSFGSKRFKTVTGARKFATK